MGLFQPRSSPTQHQTPLPPSGNHPYQHLSTCNRVVRGQIVLFSEEGTTQGDPLDMPMYALATIPLIRATQQTPNQQVWYADNAIASGTLPTLQNWWDNLTSVGPAFGYHANATKTRLIIKDEHLDRARELFHDTQVNITSHRKPHHGAALGCQLTVCL